MIDTFHRHNSGNVLAHCTRRRSRERLMSKTTFHAAILPWRLVKEHVILQISKPNTSLSFDFGRVIVSLDLQRSPRWCLPL